MPTSDSEYFLCFILLLARAWVIFYRVGKDVTINSLLMMQGVSVPSQTRKLSSVALKIVLLLQNVKLGDTRTTMPTSESAYFLCLLFYCSSRLWLVQLEEPKDVTINSWCWWCRESIPRHRRFRLLSADLAIRSRIAPSFALWRIKSSSCYLAIILQKQPFRAAFDHDEYGWFDILLWLFTRSVFGTPCA